MEGKNQTLSTKNQTAEELFPGVKVTGPPTKPAFSPKSNMSSKKVRIIENSERKEQRMREKIRLQRERERNTNKEIKKWRKQVLSEMVNENIYNLLDQDPTDDVLFFCPKQKKIRTAPKPKKVAVPRIVISRPQAEIQPIWESQVYFQHLAPNPIRGSYTARLADLTEEVKLLKQICNLRKQIASIPKAEAGVTQQDTVTQEENTTFTDQRETVHDEGYIITQSNTNLQQISMPEDQWHVRNIMSKPIPFSSGDWSTGDTQGKILKQWDIPGDTLFGPHYNTVATFTFFRGHPKIRFQLNGSKFHQGRLIAAFIPAFQFVNYDDSLYTVDNLTSMPHVMLDASIANSGVLELPFVHMNTYFNSIYTRSWQSLGRLVLVVFNKLSAATSSSQNIGWTSWVSYDNCELHQPCLFHAPSFPKSGRFAPKAEAGIEGLMKAALPVVSQLATPAMQAIGDVAGGDANMDKPTDPVEICRWVPNAVTGLSQGEGLDRSSRLCLKAGTYTVPSADLISTTRDDMNLLEIMKIPTRLESFDWKDTQTNSTSLTHIPVAPNVFTRMKYETGVKPAVQIISPTLLAYCTRGFKFWRGSLRYKVQVIASQQHTGRLLISYGAGYCNSTKSFANASFMNTYVMDLQEKHEVEFVVPYMAERPWLRCDRFRYYDVLKWEVDLSNHEILGFLDFFVLNRLSRPESVAASVEVNVFISAGDDFEVAFPSDLAGFQGIGNPIIPTRAKAEALTTQETVTARTDEGIITLGKGSGLITKAGSVTMGEDAMDLKTLLRRYTKVYTNRVGDITSAPKYMTFINSPTLSGVNKCFNEYGGVQFRTILCHYSELFTFWRGSIRYKLVFQHMIDQIGDSTVTSSGVNIHVYHVPGSFVRGNFTAQSLTDDERATFGAMECLGSIVGTTSQQGSLEFEVPFYTPYTQLRTIIGNEATARDSTGLIFITMETPNKNKGSHCIMELYQAAGDDFALNYLRAAPRVQFVNTFETGRQLGDTTSFIYINVPTTCSGVGESSPMQRQKEDDDRSAAKAEGAFDTFAPTCITNAITSFSKTNAKVESVCDTAEHLMLQASKKLGLTKKDEEKEEDTTTLLDDASQLLSPLTATLNIIIDYISRAPGHIAEYLRPNIQVADILCDLATIVSGFSTFIFGGNPIAKVCAIVSIVSTLLKDCTIVLKNQLFHFVTGIMEKVNGGKKGNEPPKAEAFSFDLVAPITATLAVATGFLGFKRIPTDKETTELCKGISEKLRLFNFSSLAFTNVKKLWTEMSDLIQWCIDYIMSLIAPQMLAQLKLQRDFNNVEEWAQFIDSLDTVAYADKIHYDYEFRNKIYSAIDTGEKFNALLIQGKCGRSASIIREYVRKIKEIGDHCKNSKNELPFRKDPFCIFMHGTTDIGKSGSITTMGFDIMDRLGYPLHNRWCAVNCTEKFFSENYRQQSAVYFDDFSTFTSEEQYQKFFNLKANTAYPLDMAFRKGEYFNSDFIFGTTNTPYPKPNFVTNHSALLRRRDLLIEADWADDDEIQEALAEKRSMAPYRRLDNSHLKFRFNNPKDETQTPGAWMSYADLVEECTVEAREHLRIQQAKLTHDLTRAGYIVPQAEVGKLIRISEDKVMKHPFFSDYDVELFKRLIWDPNTKTYDLFIDQEEDDYLAKEWEQMQTNAEALKLKLQEELILISYEVKERITLRSKITGRLQDFKDYLTTSVSSIIEKYPFIKTFGKWVVYLAAALVSVGAMYYGTKAIVHTCACAAIRSYGYRCGLCGKWPKLVNGNGSFLISEWRKIYGNEPYEDGRITTVEQESALRSIQTKSKIILSQLELGTEKSAEGIYSDITKGQIPIRISAQNGPYSQDVKGAKIIKTTAESGNPDTIISQRVFPYMYRIKTVGARGLPSITMSSYAVGDRWLLLNQHFFSGLEDGDFFQIFHNGAWMEIEYFSGDAHALPNKDACMYKMPPQFHAHKSNINHFISEAELAYFQSGKASLCKIDLSLRHTIVENLRVKALKQLHYELDRPDGKTIPYTVQNAWSYNKCSTFGDCGSLLISTNNKKIRGIILGIHSASDPNNSYAQLITKEMLENFMTRHNGTPLPKANAAELGNHIPVGHLGRIGKCDKGKGFFQSPKTEIIPTEIHGIISQPVTEPAVLSSNDKRLTKKVDPLKLGIEKYSFTSRPFPRKHRQIVNDYLNDEVKLFKKSREPKPLTMEECVLGIPELEGYERLPKNTSPGYPWILTRPVGAHGKEYLFEEESGFPIYELKRATEYRDEQARKLERVESIWVDCKKDERRPLEKIAKGSTRIFTIPPVDYSLLMRKYTLDFSVAVKNSREFMDCKVGIDPQSLEWTTLYYWLAEFSPFCVAGDFTRFDGSMPADLMFDVKEEVKAFYGDNMTQEDHNALDILWDELVHTVHLAKDEFYMTHIGNKSGNPFTVIINSRINKRYMALAWLGLCERFGLMEYFSMAKFRENVRLAIYGDDNLLSIKEEVLSWFNQETISAYLAEYKIIYTNEEKTGITKFKLLKECTFLKQSFADHESISMIKVPHMKLATILELLNWTRVAPDQDELLFDNCNDSLRFAYFYGEKFFNQLRNKIIIALQEKEKHFQPKTYMDYHLWFLNTIGTTK